MKPAGFRGGGKVPVSPNYVIGENAEGLVLHNFEGKTYTYPNPARAARSPLAMAPPTVPNSREPDVASPAKNRVPATGSPSRCGPSSRPATE